jgi:hypothetical protein
MPHADADANTKVGRALFENVRDDGSRMDASPVAVAHKTDVRRWHRR